jgi:hypothetical protein
MTCVSCGKEVKRVCRDCQAKRARDGMLLHQRRFLQTWLAGGIELRVREYNGSPHIELFDDRWHSYCGIPMMTLTNRRRVRELPDEVCTECREVFQGLVEKAAPR